MGKSQFVEEIMNEEMNNCRNEILELLKLKDNIILFGAGASGKIIFDFFEKNGITPIFFCDNNLSKVGKKINNVNIISSEQLANIGIEVFIVISCDAYQKVEDQLCKMGFHTDQIIFFDPRWVKGVLEEKDFIINNIDKFEEVYNLLGDKKSKHVFINLLKYKISYKLQYIKEIAEKGMYFDKGLVKLKESAIFLDVGSYIGDTVLEYVKFVNYKYMKIVCFEPNEDNVRQLKETIDTNNLKDIDIYSIGVSDRRQTLNFDKESDIGSRISEEGKCKIEVDTIDNICYNKYPHIDYIKMDIEGSEYYALLGAKNVIYRDRPILAICVYHKKDDFYKLPLLIKQLYNGYELYFRQYELSPEETVCYAVPREE